MAAAVATTDPIQIVAGLPVAAADGWPQLGQNQTYYSWACMILVCGLFPLGQCTQQYLASFSRLPSVFRGYALLLIWDWALVLNYLLRDAYTVAVGYVVDGLWCKALGFLNISAVLALRVSAAITSYATYKLAMGQPMRESTLLTYQLTACGVGAGLASLFLIHDAYGPYKGLYCCLKETEYQPYATVPCFLVTFSSMIAVLYFHYQALTWPAQKDAITEVIVKRSLIHGITFYVIWSLVIAAGTVTAMGGSVPPSFDIAAAWLVKMQPLVDSFLLMHTLDAVLHTKQTPR